MLAKGTPEYKAAGTTANKLSRYANIERWNNNSSFEITFNELGILLDKIMNAGGFAAQVATTIEKSMNPYGFKVANMSDKQAWILACAMVENNISFE